MTKSILSSTRSLLQRTQLISQLSSKETADLIADWQVSTDQLQENLSIEKLTEFFCIMGAGGRFATCIEDISENDPNRDLKRMRCQAQYQVEIIDCLLEKEKQPAQNPINPSPSKDK